MKRAYTREEIVTIVKGYDVRAQTLDSSKIDTVLDQAYAELCTVVQAFSNEEVVDVATYRDVGEYKFTLDIVEDVTSIYDLYVTIENEHSSFSHGIQEIRDDQVIWQDNRYNGRVHIDLSRMPNAGSQADSIVIKYYYVPVATSETVYLDAQTMLAFKNAIGVALTDQLKDIEGNIQKRAAMTRTAKAILLAQPEDAFDPNNGHIFSGLVH